MVSFMVMKGNVLSLSLLLSDVSLLLLVSWWSAVLPERGGHKEEVTNWNIV